MQDQRAIFDLLLKEFSGCFFVPFIEGARRLGYAKQTAYNLRSLDQFPIPIVERNGRLLLAVQDMASYVARGGQYEAKSPALCGKVPLGRPSKAEEIAAKRAGLSVADWRRQHVHQAQRGAA